MEIRYDKKRDEYVVTHNDKPVGTVKTESAAQALAGGIDNTEYVRRIEKEQARNEAIEQESSGGFWKRFFG
ncbi:MAG TPA: hypothetical protein V6C63_07135 [Allocoleopsis sp.]